MEPPEGPKNKKGRPFGSGTSNAKRRELRKEKQWSALENADPTAAEHLLKHLEALEKAQKRCQEKLTEAIQEQLENVSLEESSSSAARPSKVATGFGKVLEQQGFEKVQQNGFGKGQEQGFEKVQQHQGFGKVQQHQGFEKVQGG